MPELRDEKERFEQGGLSRDLPAEVTRIIQLAQLFETNLVEEI